VVEFPVNALLLGDVCLRLVLPGGWPGMVSLAGPAAADAAGEPAHSLHLRRVDGPEAVGV
jgi:hypothetical protein